MNIFNPLAMSKELGALETLFEQRDLSEFRKAKSSSSRRLDDGLAAGGLKKRKELFRP